MKDLTTEIIALPWEKGNTKRFWKYLERNGGPQDRFKSIQVTGTNGKGSVSAKIASGLQKAGVKVGLYTSPHIDSLLERIRINGKIVDLDTFNRAAEKVLKTQKDLSFFEGITAVAFEVFADAGVDVAVLEAGVGGNLCSTNCVKPVLSCITSISFDHEEYLGNTLDVIAKDKAGVIKEGVPVVLGARAQRPVVFEAAAEKKAPTICGIISEGYFDDENNEIASLALMELKKHFSITDAMICQACLARPRNRFEVLSEPFGRSLGFKSFPPYVVLDVAHNPDALEHLFRAIALKLPSMPIRICIGMCRDKKLESCFAILEKHASRIHVISGDHPRLASVNELLAVCPSATAAPQMEDMIQEAAREGEILVFAGSFYIMPKIRKALNLS